MSAFVRLQHALPQHRLSRLVGRLAASEHPALSRLLVRAFARHYRVNMAEAERPDLASYRSFNDFFTRALRPGARPMAPGERTVVSPADGVVSQAGRIEEGKLLQAKGLRYPFEALAGGLASAGFEGGTFATIYLSPRDYHRVHLPFAGRLVRTAAIPGKLFSVNAATEAGVQGLFAVNERLVTEWETAAGRMLVVFVGALIVASIETVWDGPRSPYRRVQVDAPASGAFATGDEIGRFLLGSTVVVAFEKDRVALDPSVVPGATLRMGQAIGRAR